MPWLTALSVVRRFWWAPIILGLALALLVTRGTLTARTNALKAEIAAHDATKADYAVAQLQARANAVQTARETEQHYARIQKEQQDDLQKQLADARAATQRYVDRMRVNVKTAQSAAGQADLPGASATASGAIDAGADTIVPRSDLLICAENTVKAQGWQSWWSDIEKAPSPQ